MAVGLIVHPHTEWSEEAPALQWIASIKILFPDPTLCEGKGSGDFGQKAWSN